MPIVKPVAPPRGARERFDADSADAAERRQALRRADAAEADVALLAERLTGETQAAVRAAVFEALIEIGDAAAARLVLEQLRSEDAALRNEAVVAAQRMPGPVGALMPSLLADADPDVRIFAVDILQELPHPDAPSWIAARIGEETEVNVVGAMVDRLAEIGDASALPALRAVHARHGGVAYLTFTVDMAVERIEGRA